MPDQPPTKTPGSAALVTLLATVIFIHALDRGSLATASPLIKDELHLSNLQIGVLTSAFFWVYVPGQLLAGWVIQRLNAYRTLSIGVAIWALATLLSGFASGFATLLGLRLLLGLGECAGFPASSKLLAQHVKPERLGMANGLVTGGLMAGNGAGTLFGGLMVARLGWRALFFVFGALSLTWLAPWSRHARDSARPHESTQAQGEPAFAELLSRRELWGASLGQFAVNYPYFLVLSWLPLYLVKSQGYSLGDMARLGGAVYVLTALFGLAFGRAADLWMSRGASANRVRKTMMCSGAVIAIACMLTLGLGGPRVAVVGLLVYSLSLGLTGFNLFAIGQTLAGPRAAGKWIGIQNAVGGISGMLGPIATGYIIDRTGSFSYAFLAAGAVVVMGLVCWGLVIGRVEPVRWKEAATAMATATTAPTPN